MLDLTSSQFKLALDQSAVWAVTDSSGIITYVNDTFCQLSEYKREELIGKSHQIINSGFHSKDFFENLWNTILKGKVWQGEIKNKSRTGKDFWLSTSIVPILDSDQNIVQFIAIRHETTEKKILEEELSTYRSELKFYKAAIDQTSIVAITDAKGVITYVNDKFCEISQYKREELLGKTHKIVNSKFHPKTMFQEMWKTIAIGGVWKGEIKNITKHGTYYWVDTTIIPILDESSKPQQYVAIRNDITGKKEAELELDKERERLVYSEKMASLGIMSAGIAHEIGNPLAALRGRLEMLDIQGQKSNLNPESVLKTVNTGIQLVDRINRIVKGLRAYARDGSNDPFELVDATELIKDILELVQEKSRKKNIDIIQKGFEVPHKIFCRDSEIGQVVVNLINNAIDAISELNEKWVEVRLIDTDDFLEIRVTDSGNGIPYEVQKKIFDPFFTTKPAGFGTGLGLSISNNIILSHGGRFAIDETCENTRFVIQLPKKQSN